RCLSHSRGSVLPEDRGVLPRRLTSNRIRRHHRRGRRLARCRAAFCLRRVARGGEFLGDQRKGLRMPLWIRSVLVLSCVLLLVRRSVFGRQCYSLNPCFASGSSA